MVVWSEGDRKRWSGETMAMAAGVLSWIENEAGTRGLVVVCVAEAGEDAEGNGIY